MGVQGAGGRLQPQYSLLSREIEWEVIPAALHTGLGCCRGSPLAGASSPASTSVAARRPQTRGPVPKKPLYQSISEEYADSDRNWDTIDTVVRIAKRDWRAAGASRLELDRRPAKHYRPDRRCRTVEHLRSNLGAAELTLDKDTTEALEKVSRPQFWRLSLLGSLANGSADARYRDGNDAPPSPAGGLHEHLGKKTNGLTTDTLEP